MLVGTVVLSVLLYPMVLGQSVDFEQECHILKTLDTLETRLKLQEKLSEEYKTQLEQQEVLLGKQNASLLDQETRMEEQHTRILELEAQVTAFNQSTKDQTISFHVFYPEDTNTTDRVTFTRFKTNIGGGYNTTTGEFTCSVAGSYAFSLTLTMVPEADSAHCRIFKGSQYIGEASVNPSSPATGYFPASATVYVHLLPGDKVFLDHCTKASTMVQGISSWFHGYLINMD